MDNIQKVYAIGFKTNLDKNPVIYYISKQDLDPSKVILSLVNQLLRAKYDKITFYCHNLAGYDIVFILKVLYTYNDCNEDQYNISPVLRHDKIIKVTIGKNKHSFTILDSYLIFSDNLRDLAANFEVKTPKSIFPYKFAIKGHLFYKGNTPGINYYYKIYLQAYKAIYSDN